MKYIYQIEIDSSGCNYELWLNYIRIDIQKTSHPITYDLPINQWIKNGNNTIKLVLLPLFDDSELLLESYLKVNIARKGVSNNNINEKVNIFQLQSPDLKKQKEISPNLILSNFIIKSEFEVQINFKNDIFYGLSKLSITLDELIDYYTYLYSLFLDKKKDKLLELMEFKMKQFSTVYNTSFGYEKNRQSAMLDVLFEKKLDPLNIEACSISFFLDKKIVCLEDFFGDPPITYTEYYDEDMYTTYPLFLGKKTDTNKWIIVM